MSHPTRWRWASDYPDAWPPLMVAAAAVTVSMPLEQFLTAPIHQSERQWHATLVDHFNHRGIRVSTRTLRRWKRILEDHPTPERLQ